MLSDQTPVDMIEHAMQALAHADPDIARAYPLVGAPSPRQRDPGFATFFSTIVSQQISTEAARAIMGRVNTLLPELHAKAVMEVEGQGLRDAGLSWRKIEYAKGLAEAELAGTFSADGLAHLSDDEAIAAITQLRGFGRWSAEIYLMFAHGRPDIMPGLDLGLVIAAQHLKKLRKRPDAKRRTPALSPTASRNASPSAIATSSTVWWLSMCRSPVARTMRSKNPSAFSPTWKRGGSTPSRANAAPLSQGRSTTSRVACGGLARS